MTWHDRRELMLLMLMMLLLISGRHGRRRVKLQRMLLMLCYCHLLRPDRRDCAGPDCRRLLLQRLLLYAAPA